MGPMNPFHKTVMTHLTAISIVNTQKIFIFVFFIMYIYNTILYITFKLQKKIASNYKKIANARVFIMQCQWMVNLTSFALDCRYQLLSFLSLLLKVIKTLS